MNDELNETGLHRSADLGGNAEPSDTRRELIRRCTEFSLHALSRATTK